MELLDSVIYLENRTTLNTEDAYTEPFVSKLSAGGDISVALYCLFTAVLSLCLNAVLLGVAYRKRRKTKTLDCLIINLALTDISLAICVFPLLIYSSFAHRWSFGDAGCYYFAGMSFALGVGSMTCLAEIAFIRYLMVCRSKAMSGCFTGSGVSLLMKNAALVVFPYMHGCFWALGPLLGWGAYGYLPYGTACSLSWSMADLSFLMSSCLCCLVLPVLVMTVSYIQVVRKHSLSRRTMMTSRTSKKTSRLTLKTFCMCLVFVLAWTPYAVIGLATLWIPETYFPMPVFVIPSLCAKTSVTTNPILHAALSSTYRKDVKQLFGYIVRCCRQFTPHRHTEQSNSLPVKHNIIDLTLSRRLLSEHIFISSEASSTKSYTATVL